MPRIRTLKPEHRQHRKVGPWSDRVYRLFVSMILEADDYGRFICDASHLRAVTWPYHPKVTMVHVEEAIQAIAGSGMLRLYEVESIRYAVWCSWADHQRISHPTDSILPSIDSILPSIKDSRVLQNNLERSGTLLGELEGKGRELEGRTTLSGSPPDVASPTGHEHGPAAMNTAARAILAFLNKKAGKHFQSTPTNLDLITARLREGATVDHCRAIIGMKTAEWKGDAKMCQYLRPETLFNRTKFASYQGELPATAFQEKPDAL